MGGWVWVALDLLKGNGSWVAIVLEHLEQVQ
jgi:hypothetical protein